MSIENINFIATKVGETLLNCRIHPAMRVKCSNLHLHNTDR